MYRRIVTALVLAGTIGAGTKSADPLQASGSMIGSWTCSYTMGGQTSAYTAVMSWALGGTWIRERDSSTGFSDEGLFTYNPGKHQWSFVVVDSTRTPTLFVANGASSTHVVYHSVYPDASMTEIFDRVSPTKYTIHFTQTAGGKTTSSVDVCTKRT